jgi:hypothetical protein
MTSTRLKAGLNRSTTRGSTRGGILGGALPGQAPRLVDGCRQAEGLGRGAAVERALLRLVGHGVLVPLLLRRASTAEGHRAGGSALDVRRIVVVLVLVRVHALEPGLVLASVDLLGNLTVGKNLLAAVKLRRLSVRDLRLARGVRWWEVVESVLVVKVGGAHVLVQQRLSEVWRARCSDLAVGRDTKPTRIRDHGAGSGVPRSFSNVTLRRWVACAALAWSWRLGEARHVTAVVGLLDALEDGAQKVLDTWEGDVTARVDLDLVRAPAAELVRDILLLPQHSPEQRRDVVQTLRVGGGEHKRWRRDRTSCLDTRL